jgi:hypothetical protein
MRPPRRCSCEHTFNQFRLNRKKSSQPNDECSRPIKSTYLRFCMIVRPAITSLLVAVLVLPILLLGKTLQGY